MERLIRTARFHELSPGELYGLLQLRARVFVVEQQCVYLDPDGHDTDPTTTQFWIDGTKDEGVIAALRLRRTQPGSIVGRVVTHADHREEGLATRLVEAAMRVAPRPVRVHAQSPLEGWYERFGFVKDGQEFLEDGIPHVPMIAL